MVDEFIRESHDKKQNVAGHEKQQTLMKCSGPGRMFVLYLW